MSDDLTVMGIAATAAAAMGREQIVLAHQAEHPLAGNPDVATDPKPSPDLAVALALIAKIVTFAQAEAFPLQWLSGHGWGHTQGEFYRSLTESGASLLDTRWDFLWRDIFHSHNLVLELVYEPACLGFSLLQHCYPHSSPLQTAHGASRHRSSSWGLSPHQQRLV